MKYIMSLMAVLMFSGCASKMIDAGNRYTKEKRMDEYVTVMCYDYWNKKDCPLGTLGRDLDVLSSVPGDSRFCFGFSDRNITFPEGMTCVRRNLVK